MTRQEQKAHPQTKDPQTPPPKPPYYLDPNEDDPDDSEDSLEASGMELSEPGGSANEVEEGDRIFITMYIPPEAISATSTISQRIAEESVKDNLRQEKSLHNMVSPRFWGHVDVFAKKSFDSLPRRRPWDHAIKLTSDYQSPCQKLYPLSPIEQAELDKFLEENLASGRIHPSKSPMAAPFFFMKKKDGSL